MFVVRALAVLRVRLAMVLKAALASLLLPVLPLRREAAVLLVRVTVELLVQILMMNAAMAINCYLFLSKLLQGSNECAESRVRALQ